MYRTIDSYITADIYIVGPTIRVYGYRTVDAFAVLSALCVCFAHTLYYYKRAVPNKYEFLAARSQFDRDQGVDFYVPTCCKSATFTRPRFALIVLYFLRKK